jgi:hypothetical protein
MGATTDPSGASRVLAEVEVWHTRPLVPTRRVALGALVLPVDPAPGLGGVLLAAVAATHVVDVDPDLVPDLHRLLGQVERDERIVQPRLRHRFQADRHALACSHHRLLDDDGEVRFEIATHGAPLAQVLGALYALERLETGVRRPVGDAIRRGMRWRGPLDAGFAAFVAGGGSSVASLTDPRAWALEVLGFPAGTVRPTKREVQARFRHRLRGVHPDYGGDSGAASRAIEDLGEARRVLLSS